MTGVLGVLLALALVLIVVVAFRAFFHSRPRPGSDRLRIAFIHPDLGVGGAEKLVVEAAVGLQKRGHSVEIFTSFHDPSHSFPATHDGTLNVRVHGNWLPHHTSGRFQLVKALTRFFWVSLAAMRRHAEEPFHVYFVDQISATIPLLRLSGAEVLFYCHFPDQLLTQRKSLLKYLYRLPLDALEEITTGAADAVVVNSEFTKNVFKETFRHLSTVPEVVYPAVEMKASIEVNKSFPKGVPMKIVSLNRFERKKNVGLALQAFSKLVSIHGKGLPPLKLIIAGGYDVKVSENVEHLKELQALAKSLKVDTLTTFLPSISTKDRDALLSEALCLLYTPEREHFGIVPLEAALMGTAVVACDSGGPLETIVDGVTGYLRSPSPEKWAEAIATLVEDPTKAVLMGQRGKTRVEASFSAKSFIDQLENLSFTLSGSSSKDVAPPKRRRTSEAKRSK